MRDWDRLFLNMAFDIAKMSTCTRRDVGCVLTKGHEIISLGFNGVPPGFTHCKDKPCEKLSDCLAVHAEANAILRAKSDFDTAYITCTPCRECMKLLISKGITRIVAGEIYDVAALSFFDGKVQIINP